MHNKHDPESVNFRTRASQWTDAVYELSAELGQVGRGRVFADMSEKHKTKTASIHYNRIVLQNR